MQFWVFRVSLYGFLKYIYITSYDLIALGKSPFLKNSLASSLLFSANSGFIYSIIK